MRWAALALAAVARAVVTQPKPAVTPPTPAVAPRTGKLGEFDFDKLAPYEQLRGEFDREKILGFMAERPLVVAKRLGVVASTFKRTRDAWEADEATAPDLRTRGGMLRDAIASLGPVSVKVGQTLSQRPDLVGEEACEALKALQTRNAAFSNEAAFAYMADEFGLEHPGLLAPGIVADPSAPFRKTDAHWLASLEREPAAVASLGPGQQKRAKFPTSKAPISAVFHSFRLIFGRAIIPRSALEAWMLFLERVRAEHSH